MVKTNGQKLRRTVFWLVLIGGIGLLSFIIFYYSGYRFDWRQGRFIQLGSIAVDVFPEESSVFLNGDVLPKTTPAIFNSVHPGEYTLRIEHAGYAPVEFPITVKSKSATVVSNIFLPPLVPSFPIPQPKLEMTQVTERQLAAVQQIQDWPIWKIVGINPVTVVSGPQRRLSVVDGTEVSQLDENVTDVEANPELNQLVFSKTGTAWMVYTSVEPFNMFIISRQTAPFRDVLLIPNMQSIILTDNSLIQLVQIGPNESLSIHQVAVGNDLQSTQLDSSGKILYFQDGEQWYQLELFK